MALSLHARLVLGAPVCSRARSLLEIHAAAAALGIRPNCSRCPKLARKREIAAACSQLPATRPKAAKLKATQTVSLLVALHHPSSWHPRPPCHFYVCWPTRLDH